MIKLTRRMRYLHNKKIKHSKSNLYKIDEAIKLLKDSTTVKFVESLDIAINLSIDPKKSDQNIKGTTILKYGTGRLVKIAVFASGQDAEDAKKNGADFIGMEDLVNKIKMNQIKFDLVIATSNSMKIVRSLSSILGPKGLMPNVKLGTITNNVAKSVYNAKNGQIFYRNDKNAVIHTSIGKIDFDIYKLKENFLNLLHDVKKRKPVSVKNVFIKKIYLSTTMGYGVNIDPIEF
ncbi:MAG: 50S ribosomal protein L1 [Arsenophonus sp.]|nr:MAG: 50S ribosomal protein L1 [Arsenophonus sp.]